VSLLSTSVRLTIRAPRTLAFSHIVPINLASVFIGYGPLPAVTGTRAHTGAWDAAGQRRIVLLSDGSEAQETLTAYVPGESFAYTVSGFTGPLRFLVRTAQGEWRFSDLPDGRTQVEWHYTFVPRGRFAAPLLALLCRTLWRGYMKLALRLCRDQVESLAAVQELIGGSESA
jgi:hypothetical protein